MAHAVAEMTGVPSSFQKSIDRILNLSGKTDCRLWLLSESVFPSLDDSTQHWGLGVALDGIAAYQNWVSGWLLPVAFLWIYENKEKICQSKGWARLPDDINETVKAALEFALKQKLLDGNFMVLRKNDVVKSQNVNETWRKTSKKLRSEIREKSEYPDFASLPKPH